MVEDLRVFILERVLGQILSLRSILIPTLPEQHFPAQLKQITTEPIGVFILVTRGWAASEFLTCASKFNMMPNGEHQIIGPDRSQTF